VNRIERFPPRLRQGLAHLGINTRGKFIEFDRDFASLLPVDDMSHGFDNLLPHRRELLRFLRWAARMREQCPRS
jgi:hypothetical protein